MDGKLIAAFSALTTGIYVMTVRDGERRHGMSSSWVTQVSADPPLLMAAVDHKHFTHDIIARTGRFALNVVGRGGRHLEDYFYSAASRRPDNLEGIAWTDSAAGLPFLNDAMLSIECEVAERVPAGDHTLFVARITDVVVRTPDAPLTSHDLEYVYVGEVVKRGKI
jgi:flavin reductase (DIM6/NTAB) family NADH-FMN oxidoreductase RutF